jgi:conjugal transfer pilus assembly protein TraV
MKYITPLLLASSVLLLSGCMTPIGKEEFTCPNQKKGGVCAGARDIYNLTNTRENLEGLSDEQVYDGYTITVDEDGKKTAKKRAKNEAAPSKVQRVTKGKGADSKNEVVYEPREHTQHNHDNYQPAKVISQVRNQPIADDEFSSWPRATEPLAPEPLAVIEPPKIMRVLVASFKDHKGNLNMPGYVYVQVEPETWSVGEAANLRPQRVIPTQIREKATDEAAAQAKRKLGVSPIETTVKSGG